MTLFFQKKYTLLKKPHIRGQNIAKCFGPTSGPTISILQPLMKADCLVLIILGKINLNLLTRTLAKII